MDQGCNYPGCTRKSIATWATVPVCLHCYLEILTETLKYYDDSRKRISMVYKQRPHFEAIRHMTPWRRKDIESDY